MVDDGDRGGWIPWSTGGGGLGKMYLYQWRGVCAAAPAREHVDFPLLGRWVGKVTSASCRANNKASASAKAALAFGGLKERRRIPVSRAIHSVLFEEMTVCLVRNVVLETV